MKNINTILSRKSKYTNKDAIGYQYYLPQGVNLKSIRGLNSVLYYNHNKMYLYVDLVAYYHKVENTYKINDKAFYSKKIDIDGKTGYLEINEIDNRYFIEYVYNYSKVEAYASKNNLNKTLTVMSYILNSIKFQDSLLDSLVGEASLKYHEEDFNIFKANGNDTKFIDVVEENDDGRLNSKDEDILELDEDFK